MKQTRPFCVAVMPARNAVRTIAGVIRSVQDAGIRRIIVVDNRSTDETSDLAARCAGVTVHAYTDADGYGNTMKRCIAYALDAGADIVVEIHPDGEYGVDGIRPGLDAIRRGASVIIGNRFGGIERPYAGGMHRYKYLALTMLSQIQSVMLGTDIPDYQCGFRIYTRGFLLRLPLPRMSGSYVFGFEIMCLAHYFRQTVSSVPVSSRYVGKKRGIYRIASVWYLLSMGKVLVGYLLAHTGLRTGIFDTEETTA